VYVVKKLRHSELDPWGQRHESGSRRLWAEEIHQHEKVSEEVSDQAVDKVTDGVTDGVTDEAIDEVTDEVTRVVVVSQPECDEHCGPLGIDG
jgi:hypothetical protein